MFLKEIFKQIEKEKKAIAQFNVSDNNQLKGIIEVVKKYHCPVIIGFSENERTFFGLNQARAIIDAYKKDSDLDIFISADHSKSFETAKKAIDAGFDYIHFDGSVLSFEENIKITQQVVKYAKSRNKNLMIEAELGYLAGSSKIQEIVELKEEDFTRPEEAKKFVEETGIDSLAIAIGNFHGIALKTKEKLDINRLKEIFNAVSSAFLVLHGASGVEADDILSALENGIKKININTEIRVAYRNALEKTLKNTSEVAPYKIFTSAIEAVKEEVEKKLKLFGW